MPIVLGLAASHAPNVVLPAEHWPALQKAVTNGVPQPAKAADETPEVIEGYCHRLQQSLGVLRDKIRQANLDVLVMLGDDQNEVFSQALVPTFAIYLGKEASGTTSIRFLGEKPEDNHITLTCASDLSRDLLENLLRSGFDLAYIEKLVPVGRPANGLSHAYVRLGKALNLHEAGLPTIILFQNSYHPPLPSARRCYELGRALRAYFKDRPERVGILASGGLSHDPMGPRAGWVDESMDRWILDRLAKGEGEQLTHLFTFQSDTFHGGSGEIRTWITLAGAMEGERATVVDYVATAVGAAGLGFAYWLPGGERASRQA